ncbi:class I SAM-dependent methyltransferase [Phenylobacterium sp. LjRoot219]|uniref:class I SAM-dependent methyltransferase n=1 Tax=Phenylobacterium sp. LjRoot219 TaxID=3342283 RepID=UPI003ECFB97D
MSSATTQALVERLLAERPAFHAWPDGTPANWSVAGDVLRHLAALVQPGMKTLETGAGQTTVAFALAGAEHVCITPDATQATKIRDYLATLGAPHALRFIHQSSDEALPSGHGIPEQLDVVLIDGAHRFPFPILDWYYTQARVPVGGHMIVDDYNMPSVRILHDFLVGEDEWELAKAFEVTAFFRRVKATVSVWDWADQQLNKPHLERLRQKEAGQPAPQNLSAWVKRLVGAGS